jgi:hypothetical protein
VFRDRLPFGEVPIKLYLRHKRRSDQPTPEEADALQGQADDQEEGARRPQKEKADLSGLNFRSTVTDEELERDRKYYESELWKDL